MNKKVITSSKPTKEKGSIKVSQRFITALSIVSILGFLAIVSETLLDRDITFYIEALLMLVIGAGLIIEVKLERIKTITKGLSRENFTDITTIVIGFVAIIAGIFSFPNWRIETPSFLAIKGIISIIAIVIIFIQTWIIDTHRKG